MSDIKNEFKNKLEEFENAGSFLVTRSEIVQFITTIESQQKERDEAVSDREEALKNFNAIKNEYFANKKLIESQKEEIRLLNFHLDSRDKAIISQADHIESQKEEIKRLSTCQDCGGSGVNELCHDPYYVVPCICTVDWYSENMELRKQIESLKAITELAVKGFQMLKAMSSKDEIPAALYNTASWYLDEIANLEVKHEQT